MRTLILLVCAGVIAWLLVTCNQKPTFHAQPSQTPQSDATPIKVPPPEEEATAFLTNSYITTDDLINFCANHPQAQQLLYEKPFHLSGTVKRLAVFGMEADRAEVTMQASSNRLVILECEIKNAGTQKVKRFQVKDDHLELADRLGDKKSIIAVGANDSIAVSVKSVSPVAIKLFFPIE